jgi:hypothetical protein
MNFAKKRQSMTPQEEDRILRHAEYVDAGLVRVECLRLTLPVLRKAVSAGHAAAGGEN